MSDPNDLAKLEYTLQHPDNIVGLGKSQAYSESINGRNQTANTVRYEKDIGKKTYYVIQAIPRTKAKTLYIVTAFIGKKGYNKGATQLINANNPNATSEVGSASTPVDIIPQNEEKVNTQLQARNNKDLLDGYTEELYNKRGWAFVNHVLYGRMSHDINSKIASIRHGGHFDRMPDGTYIIPTGAEEGVNNVLVFTDGKLDNLTIKQVIRINFDNETEIAPVRNSFTQWLLKGYDYEYIVSIFENHAGPKLFDRFRGSDFGNYRSLRESSESRRRSDNDNRGIGNRTGSAGTDTSEIRETERNTQLQARNLNSDLDTVTRRNLADALEMHADTLSLHM